MTTKVTILKEFRDKDNFARAYKVGEEVTGFDEERIANLVSRGLVKVDEPAGDKGKGPAVLDLPIAELTTEVAKVEDVSQLNELLAAEKEGKNRAGAVKAIEARITELS